MRLPTLILAALLVLVAVASASPSYAQEGTEAYSNDETEQLSEELRQAQAREKELADEEDAMRDGEIEYDGGRSNEINGQQSQIWDELEFINEDLVVAKLDLIRDAPDGRLDEAERKLDALQALEGYADEELGGWVLSDATFDVRNERQAAEERVETLRASAEEQAAEKPAAEPAGGAESVEGTESPGIIGGLLGGVLGLIGWFLKTAFVLFVFLGLPLLTIGGAIFFALKALGVISGGTLAGATAGLVRWGFRTLTGRGRSRFEGRSRSSGEPDEGRRGRNVAGARGEAKVNQLLSALAREGHYSYTFSNLYEEGIGNIDHILVSQSGVVIVETKSNSGEVILDDHGNLAANGKPFSRDPFSQAASQLAALRRRIGDVPGDYLVCLAAAPSVQRSPDAPNAERLVMLDELADTLSALPQRLSKREVSHVADEIMGRYGAAPIASPGGPTPGGPTVGGSSEGREEEVVDGEDVSPRQTAEEMLRETTRSFARKHGVEVTYTDEALSALLRAYDKEKQGGYPSMRRVVDSRVGRKLADFFSAGKVGAGEAVEVAVRNGQVAFRRVTETVRVDGGSGSPAEPPKDDGGGKRRCPECGSEVGTGARFCGQCGDPMDEV